MLLIRATISVSASVAAGYARSCLQICGGRGAARSLTSKKIGLVNTQSAKYLAHVHKMLWLPQHRSHDAKAATWDLYCAKRRYGGKESLPNAQKEREQP